MNLSRRFPSRTFPIREKSGNFEQTGKVLSHKILENRHRQMLFVIFGDISMNCVLFIKMDQVSSLFCQSGKVGKFYVTMSNSARSIPEIQLFVFTLRYL